VRHRRRPISSIQLKKLSMMSPHYPHRCSRASIGLWADIGLKSRKSRGNKESATEWARRPRQIFVGKGLIDDGSVDVDFGHDALHGYYTQQCMPSWARCFLARSHPTSNSFILQVPGMMWSSIFAGSRVCDHSGLEAIDTLAERYLNTGKTLQLVHLSAECRRLLRKAGNLV
jgi:hypothetical protein